MVEEKAIEIWDGYREDGTLAGIDLIRGEHIPKGLFHVVCEILVRHADGDFLLMQRDTAKPNYGGMYEATAGGSAVKGEAALACAKRELLEETGIRTEDLVQIGHFVSTHTIYFNYLYVTDCDKESIQLQIGETISYKWVNEKDFISFVNSNEMIASQREHYMEYLLKQGYVSIKQANLEDVSIVSLLAINMWKEHDIEELILEFFEVISSDKAAVFLCYDKSEPIGFAQCQLRYDYVEGTNSSPVGYLEGIFVLESHRMKGYAKKMLAACEAWSMEKGCIEFASDCELDNEVSQHFHKKMGFTEMNRIICFKKTLIQ